MVQNAPVRKTRAGKDRLSQIEPDSRQKVGAELDAPLYNDLVEFAATMDQSMSWFVRVALKKFVAEHRDAMRRDPVQLSFDLMRMDKGA